MGIVFDEEVRRGLVSGMDQLANAVKVTLGPKGRNVAMHQKRELRDAEYSDPNAPDAPVLVTNDGVTIAKSIILPDPVENMGAQLLREAAEKTNDEAGDGTTTAILLTQALLHRSFRAIAAGAHPLSVREGMVKAGDAALQGLKAAAHPMGTQQEIAEVAALSCQDSRIGALIGEALSAVGLEGVVSVEDSRTAETTLDIHRGITFKRGFLSPHMATDSLQSVAELYDPYIILCDAKLTDAQGIIPGLILAAEDGRSCLVICDGIEGEALGVILTNKKEGDMDVVGVLAPEYGEGRRWRMEDLAIQTGGVYINSELGMNVRDITREMLGTASLVTVTDKQTVITGPGGNPELIAARERELRHLIETTDYEFNRDRYRQRLAAFVSGVAEIKVGGWTEAELHERKMRVEDAVNASRAALAEGVVAGGGAALIHEVPALEELQATCEGDERVGVASVIDALKAPVWQIAENSGRHGDAIVDALLEEPQSVGYDAINHRLVDMFEVGLADPLQVTSRALESALSIASTVLLTKVGVIKDSTTEQDE